MYDRPFAITNNRSNNAFSFDKRMNPTVWVPDAIEGTLDDVEIGNKVVFEDFDEHGQLKSCVGLRHFVRMTHPDTGKPIVIVDNHNHAFYFWHEALAKGLIGRGATLVHIDQHKDMRKPMVAPIVAPVDAQMVYLKQVFEYTNSTLNVGNYIPPSMEDGLVGKVISVTSEKEMVEHAPEGAIGQSRLRARPSIIVNVDLDFWSPEMDYIDRTVKDQFTKNWMKQADLITIATSPFFIDQKLALKILGELAISTT
jgi:hypothetical protein